MGFTGTTAQYNTAKSAGLIKDGMKVNITDDYSTSLTAISVGYDNTESGLSSTSVQGAIDEITNSLNNTESDVSDIKSNIIGEWSSLQLRQVRVEGGSSTTVTLKKGLFAALIISNSNDSYMTSSWIVTQKGYDSPTIAQLTSQQYGGSITISDRTMTFKNAKTTIAQYFFIVVLIGGIV